MFLLVQFANLAVAAAFGAVAFDLYFEHGFWVVPPAAVAGLTFTVAFNILVERAVTSFRRMSPRFCSIYDPYFWWHERFWKMSIGGFLALFNGTPMKIVVWRLLGVRMGRRVFDDGCAIPEKTLVHVGDDAALNATSVLQAHSLEDGAFKSDHIVIGPGVTIGPRGFVHYGVTVHEGAVLDADVFLMKGQEVPAYTRWRGNPAAETRDPYVAPPESRSPAALVATLVLVALILAALPVGVALALATRPVPPAVAPAIPAGATDVDPATEDEPPDDADVDGAEPDPAVDADAATDANAGTDADATSPDPSAEDEAGTSGSDPAEEDGGTDVPGQDAEPRVGAGAVMRAWPTTTRVILAIVAAVVLAAVVAVTAGLLRPPSEPSGGAGAGRIGTCAAAPGAEQQDVDPDDSPEAPWPHVPGRAGRRPLRHRWPPCPVRRPGRPGGGDLGAQPLRRARGRRGVPAGVELLHRRRPGARRDDDTDGESDSDDRGGVRRSNTITLYTGLLDDASDNGALATIVHEMGHALGLVHRNDPDSVMNAETDDSTDPVPDAIDFTNLVAIYG